MFSFYKTLKSYYYNNILILNKLLHKLDLIQDNNNKL